MTKAYCASRPASVFLRWLAGLALCGMMLVTACQKRTEQTLRYSPEIAGLVSQVTSGVIPPDAEIRIRFTRPMGEEGAAGAGGGLFRFNPAIEGTATWEDAQTAVFKPANPLPLRKTYRGTFDLNALLPEGEKAGALPFLFSVAGREIASAELDFEPQEEDPASPVLAGSLVFTQGTRIGDLRRAAEWKLNGKKSPLEWEGEDGGKTFTFRSQPSKRTEQDRKGIFTVDGGALGLSSDYTQEITLPAASDMKVMDIMKKEEGDRTLLVARFSDALDPRKDLSGLIDVEPYTEIRLQPSGREILISGDFRHGDTYTVNVHGGIQSKWGTVTQNTVTRSVQMEDMKPQMQFASNGVVLPPSNRNAIRFQTLNVSRVKLDIMKVFESNLGIFLQTERLVSLRTRSESFDDYFIEKIGVNVARDTLVIGDTRNTWLQHELDLSKLIGQDSRGLFLVSLSFDDGDVLYGTLDKETEKERNERRENYYYGPDYYSDPYSPGYYYSNGRIYKPVLLSDIGMIYKAGRRTHFVFTTQIEDGKPMGGVTVGLRSYQNQVIAQKKTDSQGKAVFENVEENVFYVEAEKGKFRSALKPSEMAWNLSTFDTGGEEDGQEGVRAFIYTDRGVYRPGDTVHLLCIARNGDSFPDAHPVTLKLFDPRNRKAHEETSTSGKDGFIHFSFSTQPEDPTGTWLAKLLVGSREFQYPLKIETIVPERLKITITPDKNTIGWKDARIGMRVSAATLFGTPGSGLPADVSVRLEPVEKQFNRFKGYLFTHEGMEYPETEHEAYSGVLDERGETRIEWPLPALEGVPSALTCHITARVLEKGGRANTMDLALSVDPYARYVGIKRPGDEYTPIRVGEPAQIPVVVADASGNPVEGRNLEYRIYKNEKYWWWEYENRRDFRLRYKTDESTELIDEGRLVSAQNPVSLTIKPEERGEYLIEVEDMVRGGHTAGFFIQAYHWGESTAAGDEAEILMMKADKSSYRPGEKAVIRFPSPAEGSILFTVEKGSAVLDQRWLAADPKSSEMEVSLPVTAEMAPNAYATVCVIQPHSQTLNDRPVRMYGILGLEVVDPRSRQELDIRMPETLKPNSRFKVEVQTKDGQPTQLSIAVVDEGLLSLTRFRTPDPWSGFFTKLRLGVQTSDLFSHIIGANKGDVFRIFATGGDMEMRYRESQLAGEEARRFTPVSLFFGPVQTDARGHAEASFEMPNYMGAVRVMAASARGMRFGSAEKSVPVKDVLMVLPTLPRVLGPGDRIAVPVTVFATEDGVGDVTVDLKTSGPVRIPGASRQTISLNRKGEKEVVFSVAAEPAVGTAAISIQAVSQNASSSSETELAVRASSPRIYSHTEKDLVPGQKIRMEVPETGLAGTRHASVSVRRRPHMQFSRRLKWLIQYPYGCLEQTVSSAFPQLFLKSVIDVKESDEETMDRHVNSAVGRLDRFQVPSGGFGFWPGDAEASSWASNYAGHFMTEAKSQGFYVNAETYARWLRFQKSQSLTTRDPLPVRTYRVYVLSLAGEAQNGAMNLLKENNLRDMTDTEKWLLAAAYHLAGSRGTALEISRQAGFKVKEYQEMGGTYGSAVRDRAMILTALVTLGKWQEAGDLAEALSEELSSDRWYSTQETAFSLLAIGKYLRAVEGDEKPKLKGTVTLPDGSKKTFETEEIGATFPITEGFGKEIEVFLDKASTVNRAFVTLESDGIPLADEGEEYSSGLALDVEWLDEDGAPVDPARVLQGTSFWGHFTARKTAEYRQQLDELALVQVLPAGWEIENIRLSGDPLPDWMSEYSLYRESYLDMRDDRIMWFFDLTAEEPSLDFVVKINSVTVGEYILPPAILEAMYNNQFKAMRAGGRVSVARSAAE